MSLENVQVTPIVQDYYTAHNGSQMAYFTALIYASAIPTVKAMKSASIWMEVPTFAIAPPSPLLLQHLDLRAQRIRTAEVEYVSLDFVRVTVVEKTTACSMSLAILSETRMQESCTAPAAHTVCIKTSISPAPSMECPEANIAKPDTVISMNITSTTILLAMNHTAVHYVTKRVIAI